MLPPFDHLPFDVYRARLYDYAELATPVPGDATRTLDAAIGAWFRTSEAAMPDAAIRALHDATVDVALARSVQGRRMVGVMGGHAPRAGERPVPHGGPPRAGLDQGRLVRGHRRRPGRHGGGQPGGVVRTP